MDEITEIKDKIDIVDLIGHYVTLKKAGVNYKGLCPFHHEKSPSFMVNPERQSFKCFGCSKGGDIFTFVQESETVEFGDALRILADRAGVVLKQRVAPRPSEAPSAKSRYFTINALASHVFHKLLTDHKIAQPAREYLNKRGLTNQTIHDWRIGYAPRKRVLTDLLLERGFTLEEIQLAGKPDMFYDRIMFPIIDVMGNVVGFTGRILGQGEPKYLNTPETPIFHKSRVLFGLERAKQFIKEKSQVIMTEGQMDVIAAAQAGTRNVVATSGTALTADHLRILARYDAAIVFAFDADNAGAAATKRAIDLAIADNLNVKVIPLPAPFKDVGDVAQQEPAHWLRLAQNPIPAIEWEMQTVFDRYTTNGIQRKLSVDEKKKIARELLPVIKRIPDAIEQAHYIQRLAKRLDVTESVIGQALTRVSGATKPGQKSEAPPTKTKTVFTTKETLYALLQRSVPLQEQYMNLYKELESCYSGNIQELIFVVEEQYRGLSVAELKQEILLLIKRYEQGKHALVKNEFASRISTAETAGDRQLVKKLLADFHDAIKSAPTDKNDT